MTAYRRPLVPAALAATALLLAACNGAGGSDGADGTTTTAPLTVTSTAAAEETTPDSTPDTTPDAPPGATTTAVTATTAPVDRPLGTPAMTSLQRDPVWEEPAPLLTGIRTGRHGTFDRVVYDFKGSGEPGWFAHYVDQPYQQGSGFDVDVKGEAYLLVNLTGTTYPFEHGVEDMPTGPYPGAGVIQEVVSTGVFEGDTLTYIGLDKKRPYSVSVLHNPLRVVVDIAHD